MDIINSRSADVLATSTPPELSDVRVIGCGAAVLGVDDGIDLARASDANVLIEGETGTGKTVVARLIHAGSRRASAAMVKLNCADLPDALLESELFGHVRGSFTGAYRDKPGLLEIGANGTLFLDAVSEMSLAMQGILLRFLESGEVQRVGADRAHLCVSVRIVAGTDQNLQALVESRAFREDLYSRLTVIRLAIPPLRKRSEDIPSLVASFVGRYGRLHAVAAREVSSEAMEALVAYSWPGNVRQLKSFVERLVLTARGPVIRFGDLPAEFSRGRESPQRLFGL